MYEAWFYIYIYCAICKLYKDSNNSKKNLEISTYVYKLKWPFIDTNSFFISNILMQIF